jgi:DNA-directed RNA polymerase subunit RPC12/RpoP
MGLGDGGVHALLGGRLFNGSRGTRCGRETSSVALSAKENKGRMIMAIYKCPCCDFDLYVKPPETEEEAVMSCPNCNPTGGRPCAWVEGIALDKKIDSELEKEKSNGA